MATYWIEKRRDVVVPGWYGPDGDLFYGYPIDSDGNQITNAEYLQTFYLPQGETYYVWNPASGYASEAAYLTVTRGYPAWVEPFVGRAPQAAGSGGVLDPAGFALARTNPVDYYFTLGTEYGEWPLYTAFMEAVARNYNAGFAIPLADARRNYERSEIPQAGYTFDQMVQRQYVNPRIVNVPGLGDFIVGTSVNVFDWGLGDRSGFFETLIKDILPAAVKMYGIATGITSVWNAGASLIDSTASIAADAGAHTATQTVSEVVASPILDTIPEPLLDVLTVPEVVASPILDTIPEPFLDVLTVPDVVTSPVLDVLTEPVLDVLTEPVLDVVENVAVDVLPETVYTSPEVLTEGAGVDDWADWSDWGDEVYDEWDGYTSYDPAAQTGADAWDTVVPDVTAPPVVDTMPYPGAPVDVFTPAPTSTAIPTPTGGAPLPWERILATGAGVVRSLMTPTTGQRIDPRTGRPIPPGVQLDPRTGLPVIGANGQYVPLQRAGAISPLMIAAGAGLLFFALKRK